MKKTTTEERLARAKECEWLRTQGLTVREIAIKIGRSEQIVHLELRQPVANWVKSQSHLAERALEVAYRVRERLQNTTTDPKLEKYSTEGKEYETT